MVKFKIIEKSRFDNKESIKGGVNSCDTRQYIIHCANTHATCTSAPLRYLYEECANHHGTCGYLAIYNVLCDNIYDHCGLLTVYS